MNRKVSMNLPTELLNKAVKVTGVRTKTKAVILGLEELIKKRQIKAFFKLKGKNAIKLSARQLEELRLR